MILGGNMPTFKEEDFIIPGPTRSLEAPLPDLEITPEQERVFQELRRQYYEMRRDRAFNHDNDFEDRCVDFKEKLFGLPGGIDATTNHYLSHIFGSSLTKEDKITAFDFAGEDSIVSFINREYENFQKFKKGNQL